MRQLLGFFSFLLAIESLCIAQNPVSNVWLGHVSKDTGLMHGGPDPDNVTALAKMLRSFEFSEELQLTADQRNAIEEISEKVPIPTRDQLRASAGSGVIHLYVAALDEAMQAAITPQQFLRLKQLCYRIEIGVLGIENSLAYGRLSTRIGLYENQRTYVHDKGLKIRTTVRAECEELAHRAEDEIVQTFPVDLQPLLKKELGDFFSFRTSALQGNRIAIDPARQTIASFSYLFQDSKVREDLRINTDQLEAIDKIAVSSAAVQQQILKDRKYAKLTLEERNALGEAGDQFLNAFDEILTPVQIERLNQLSLRHAIRKEGISYIVNHVEEKSGIQLSEDDRQKLLATLTKIQDRTRNSIQSLKEQIEVRIAEELTPEQRELLKTAIGPYYEYTPIAIRLPPNSEKYVNPE